MNWTWTLRSGDGAMNGLEFSRATTAGGFDRVLVHAAPGQLQVEVRRDDDQLVLRADAARKEGYSPISLLTLSDGSITRAEIWPTDEHYGLPVIIAGGEVGILRHWEHADDHSWWRWQVEFSNHKDRPADWAPPG